MPAPLMIATISSDLYSQKNNFPKAVATYATQTRESGAPIITRDRKGDMYKRTFKAKLEHLSAKSQTIIAS